MQDKAIRTTVVGSYPIPSWLSALPSTPNLRDAILVVMKTQEMAGIEHALKKFEEGTYGLCDSCGQPIAPERLEALPQASLCLNCKAQQAKNAKSKPPSG